MGLFDKINDWFAEQEKLLEERMQEEEVKNKLYRQYLNDKRDKEKALVETPAYKRLYLIMSTLHDLSSTVKEIKMIEESTHKRLYSLRTNLGERWLVVGGWSIKFYQERPQLTQNKYSSLGQAWTYYEGEYLYEVKICPETKNIYIHPSLTSGAPMSEEQIYNSLVEIENIFMLYDFSKASEEHKHNFEIFVKRFEG